MENKQWKIFKNEIRKNKMVIFAIAFIVVIIVVSLLAPLLNLDPSTPDPANRYAPPSWEHWFGTDKLGRDYFSQAIYGGRVSLLVGVLAMVTSVTIGVTVGAVAGYFGGIVDNILMRIVDMLMAIPWMILVTVASILFKPGITTVILVIGLFTWMDIARLVRAETLSAKEKDYVGYSQFLGRSSFSTIFSHIFPAILPTVIVTATYTISSAIMTESSLSFLGFGVRPPMTSWGAMLQSAQGEMERSFILAVVPGVLIMLTVFSFNKIGNVLRVVVEPNVTAGDE